MTQTDHVAKAIAFAWATAFVRWPIFKMVSFLEYVVFFGALFANNCNILGESFLAFLIFDPYWQSLTCLRLGYSLYKMADFQNCLISGILGVFGGVFCTEQLQRSCRIVFGMFLAFLIFDQNWSCCKGYRLCMDYSLCKMADFQNGLISRIFRVFWSGFFLHRTTLVFLWNSFWHVFGIFNIWPKLTIFYMPLHGL